MRVLPQKTDLKEFPFFYCSNSRVHPSFCIETYEHIARSMSIRFENGCGQEQMKIGAATCETRREMEGANCHLVSQRFPWENKMTWVSFGYWKMMPPQTKDFKIFITEGFFKVWGCFNAREQLSIMGKYRQ